MSATGFTRRCGLGLFALVLIALLLCAPAGLAESTKKKKGGFRDPEDGKFDMSASLLDRHGFLPVPSVITDPRSVASDWASC